MGNKIKLKLIFLSILFGLIAAFIFNREETTIPKKPPLKGHFTTLTGYTPPQHVELADHLVTMLNLDDYFYANFVEPRGTVTLYIGYYYSADKAYAAHSPLICYPSQGWTIDSSPTTHDLQVESHTIHYEEIVTSLGTEKELVLYWYQANLLTNTQIYKNKIDMGYNKFMGYGQQHAFIRVSVPFATNTYDQTKKRAIEFIEIFYPEFSNFIIDIL